MAMLVTPLARRLRARLPERCQVIGSGEVGSQVPSRHPRYVPFSSSTPTLSVSMKWRSVVAGTRDGSRRVARVVSDAGSRLRTWQSASYWGRSSAAVLGVVLREERSRMRIDSSLGTKNVQHRVGLEDSRFDRGFLTLGEVGYVMQNLVDGVGAFDNVSYTTLHIWLYLFRHSPADSPESCRFAGSPARNHHELRVRLQTNDSYLQTLQCSLESIAVRAIDP